MELLGHQNLLAYFKRLIDEASLSHAYLLAGPASVGKRRLAEEIIAYIHCKREAPPSLFAATGIPVQAPCQSCTACLSLKNHTFSDHLSLSRETEGKHLISIESMRETMRQIAQSPSQGSRKTLLVNDAHLLSQAASNAFLKTLEEPPASSRIFLITDQPHRLPQTILSRCQVIEIPFVTTPPDGVDEQKWSLARGLPGQYVRLSENPAAEDQLRDEIKLFLHFLSETKARRLVMIEELFKKKSEHGSQKELWKARLNLWQQLLRDKTMLQLGLNELVSMNQGPSQEIDAVVSIDELRSVVDDIDRNINIRLRIESFAINL